VSRLGFFILFLFTANYCIAEEKPLRFFDFSFGYNYHYLRDEGMSPLIYSGSAASISSGFEKRSAKSIHRISILFAYGRLKPAEKKINPSVCTNLRGEIDYRFHRLLRKYADGALQLYLGGAWQLLSVARLHNRYVNNDVNYEFVISLSPDAMLAYDFKIREARFAAKVELTIPLFSFYVRPAYASSLPEGFIAQEGSDFKAFWKSGHVATVNRMFRLIYSMDLEYVLSNNNRLSFGYAWDYYRIGDYNRIKAAAHCLDFKWMFNF
jgi:hypothetical protein